MTSADINKIQEVKQLSPLGLAYIGDGIYELLAREHVMEKGNRPVNMLHKTTVSYVCAKAQANAFDLISDMLTEEEMAVYKRGRNAHGNLPKNSNPADYRKATGLEALFGYLYLLSQLERIKTLFEYIYTKQTEARNEQKTD